MQEQEWYGVGSFASFVDEMDIEAVNVSLEVGEAVDGLLLRSPVEVVLPIGDERFQVSQVGTVIPACP